MKINLSKLTIIAASIAASFACYANNEIKVDLNAASDPGAFSNQDAPSGEEISAADIEMFEAILQKSGQKEDLNPYEVEIIKQKKHALFKYLYEQEQLSSLRGIIEDNNREEKIKSMTEKEYPFTASEVYSLRKLANSIERAKNTPLGGPIDLKIKTIDIDVDAPKPIQINVAKGYSSSIMFFDQTGTPWPIEGDILGDSSSFGSNPIEGKPHVGVFEIKKAFRESNALINLKGLNVPIVIRLTGNETEVDARISVQIPKLGPDARSGSYRSSELEVRDPDMLSVLNGDKLNGGKRFELSGVNGTVWYKEGELYVRTRAHMISPPQKQILPSPSGYTVYKIPPAVELLFSVDGEMKYATVEKGFEVKIRQKKSIFDN